MSYGKKYNVMEMYIHFQKELEDNVLIIVI